MPALPRMVEAIAEWWLDAPNRAMRGTARPSQGERWRAMRGAF